MTKQKMNYEMKFNNHEANLYNKITIIMNQRRQHERNDAKVRFQFKDHKICHILRYTKKIGNHAKNMDVTNTKFTKHHEYSSLINKTRKHKDEYKKLHKNKNVKCVQFQRAKTYDLNTYNIHHKEQEMDLKRFIRATPHL